MFRSLLQQGTQVRSGLLRSYSKSAFDVNKIFAATSGTSSNSGTTGNRFANKYQDKPKASQGSNRFQPKRNQKNDRTNHSRQKHQRDRHTFEIRTGSDKAQEALKGIILKVKSLSPNFQVQFVDPITKKIYSQHLLKIVNSLDLTKEGLLFVPPKEDEGLPLVRINKLAEMLQSYSDELAAQKEAELMMLGSARFMKKTLIRQQAERKKSAAKLLTLSWSISLSDLMNQKRTEIMNRLKKDEKFQICVGDRASNLEAEDEDGEPRRNKWNNLSGEEYEFEMRKRELLSERLQQILTDLECKTETSGSMEGKLMIKVTAKQPVVAKTEESPQMNEKEVKRLKKAQKAKEMAEKKAAATEDDLDALYLFKIQD